MRRRPRDSDATAEDQFLQLLIEWHRRARTDPEAPDHLPYTVAEGFADDAGARLPADLRRVDLTRLCLYAPSLPDDERAARSATPSVR